MELQRIYRDNVKNLEEECLIEEEEETAMVEDFHTACRKLADAYVAARADESREFNPFSVLVTETAALLGLSCQDVHLALANHLADFAVSYRVGDPTKKYPLKS